MTDVEAALVKIIGYQVAGPRHTTILRADPETVELVSVLIESGMAESTGYVQRVNDNQLIRVGLTGKGWVRYKESAS